MTYTLLFFLWTVLHPFHVSVCDVVYNQKSEAVQMSYRLFMDDLENAIRMQTDNAGFVLLQDSMETHHAIDNYFKDRFCVKINTTTVDYLYLGGEPEDDVIWCYLEVEQVAQVSTMTIRNSLITEVFDDQKNITHFKINGERQSAIATKKDPLLSF